MPILERWGKEGSGSRPFSAAQGVSDQPWVLGIQPGDTACAEIPLRTVMWKTDLDRRL